MIEERLKNRTLAGAAPVEQAHPDDDTITAFVEARLAADESLPVVSHLISCGVCRRMTAQLVRLESELDENDSLTPVSETPGGIGSFLDRLASRLIPQVEEDAVFAYQNPETTPEPATADDSEAVKDDKSAP